MTNSACAAEVGALQPSWANDKLYFAAMEASGASMPGSGPGQEVANAMAASLGIALPPNAVQPRFPSRKEVAEVLGWPEPPLIALHAAAGILGGNPDRYALSKLGRCAARIVGGLFVGAAVLAEAVRQGSSSFAQAGGVVSDATAGVRLVIDALTERSRQGIRSQIDRLVERRYGERITIPNDRARLTAMLGILVRRMVEEEAPAGALVRAAHWYRRSYRVAGLQNEANPLAFAHRRVDEYARQVDLDRLLAGTVDALDRMQSIEGAVMGESTQRALSLAVEAIRIAVLPNPASAFTVKPDVL